jgi:hypothetical protein
MLCQLVTHHLNCIAVGLKQTYGKLRASVVLHKTIHGLTSPYLAYQSKSSPGDALKRSVTAKDLSSASAA